MPNAIALYRISRWLYLRKIPFFPKLIQFIIFVIYNSKVPCEASIGEKSFLVVKGIGVCIHPKCIIGKRCAIGIGAKFVGKAPYKKVPKVGDDVFVGPGAVLVGPIVVDDGAIIGANSVVTKSVPKGAIVAGVPAKIIGWVSDNEYNIMKNESTLDVVAPYLD